MPKRAGRPTYFPGRRGRSKNFFVSKVTATLSLGTLASGAVIAADLLDLEQDAWIISSDLTWSIADLTQGEGPIEVGINNDILTVAQIAESLDASPNSQDDRIAKEQSSRPVRIVGQFPGASPTSGGEVLNNGNIVRTRARMVITSARDLQVWARNISGVANLATGATVRAVGKVYGNWK